MESCGVARVLGRYDSLLLRLGVGGGYPPGGGDAAFHADMSRIETQERGEEQAVACSSPPRDTQLRPEPSWDRTRSPSAYGFGMNGAGVPSSTSEPLFLVTLNVLPVTPPEVVGWKWTVTWTV